MQTLDANVLVRHLAQDDPKQSVAASELIAESLEDESLFVPLTVLVELEQVLRSKYEVGKERFISVLSDMLETRQLKLQDEAAVERAIHAYRRSNVDFADCLHMACAFTYDALPMLTFDKAASKLEGVDLIAS